MAGHSYGCMCMICDCSLGIDVRIKYSAHSHSSIHRVALHNITLDISRGLELRSVDIFPFSSRGNSSSNKRASVTTTNANPPQPLAPVRAPSSTTPSSLITPMARASSSTLSPLSHIPLERGSSTSSVVASSSLARDMSDGDDVSRSLGFDSFMDATPRHQLSPSPLSSSHGNSSHDINTSDLPNANGKSAMIPSSSSGGNGSASATAARRRDNHDCMLILELVNTADTTFRLHCTIDAGMMLIVSISSYLAYYHYHIVMS